MLMIFGYISREQIIPVAFIDHIRLGTNPRTLESSPS
jgi:hypothetical protein